ncbi:MAG: M48 family metallopeptidase [Deinococcales bacterium]
MTPTTIQILLIVLLTLHFIVQFISEWLNMRHQPDTLPSEVRDIYDEARYTSSKRYHIEHTRLALIEMTFGFILSLIIILSGLLGRFDEALSLYIKPIWLRGVVFLGLLSFAQSLLSIPFELYRNFNIEARYGFNQMDTKTYVTDKLKGYLIAIILGGGLLALLMGLILKLGPSFWFYFWLIFSAFNIFMAMFSTSLILPLFNKLSPLEDGELKQRLEAYARGQGFALKDIFVMDGSRRSSKANAFFSGLGREKKIVLFDTLIEKMSTDEIIAVLAHEVGHYKKRHVPLFIILSLVYVGLLLFILSKLIFSESLSLALGAQGLSYPINLIAAGLLFSPLSLILGSLTNALSRRFEFQADDFAATTSSASAMQSALKNLASSNLSNLSPHPFYVMLNYSHPPMLDRLRALA